MHISSLHHVCSFSSITTCVYVQIGKCFKGTPLLIVLELLEVPVGPSGQSAGPELGDYLMSRQHKALEDEEIVAMLQMSQMVCRGVEYIHSKGIIHCDLAARNVLVDAKVIVVGVGGR